MEGKLKISPLSSWEKAGAEDNLSSRPFVFLRVPSCSFVEKTVPTTGNTNAPTKWAEMSGNGRKTKIYHLSHRQKGRWGG